MDCVICTRFRNVLHHEGSVGGYLCEDEHWYAYHAPVQTSALGQLFLVSKRHYLDFTEMASDEAAGYGLMLRRLYTALKDVTQAERVYAQVILEGIAHFHVWPIPRRADAGERGWDFITKERSCSAADATEVVKQLRSALDNMSRISTIHT